MKRPLLAIETATDVCSVALATENGIFERTVAGGRRHDAEMLAMASDLLTEAGLEHRDLAAVAVSSGPGSYTGLRIGVSGAKAICEALNIPLVAVRSLVATALASRESGHMVAAFLSRKDEVFAARITVDSHGARQRGDTLAGRPSALLADLGDGPHRVVGPGAVRFEDLTDAVPNPTEASARAVALCGLELLEQGHSVDPELFEPYYFKDFVANTPTKSVFARLPF